MLLGEDVTERGNDRVLFERDVRAVIDAAFPQAARDTGIERIEGAGHGSDTLTAVLSPWLSDDPKLLGVITREAGRRGLRTVLATHGERVGNRHTGGVESSDRVVLLVRHRAPVTMPTSPTLLRVAWITAGFLGLIIFRHYTMLF